MPSTARATTLDHDVPVSRRRTPLRRGHGDRGAVLVEFALLLPLFMCIVLGLFTGGLVLSHKQSLTQASREAARYGATVPTKQCPADCGGYSDWAHLVQAVAIQRSDGELKATDTVCVALVSGNGASPSALGSGFTTAGGTNPCFADGSSDNGPRVQIRVQRDDTMQWYFKTVTVTLTADSVAHYEAE